MKMIAEYLEQVIHFEQMAAKESDPQLKTHLLAQAEAYRKLAAQRALQGNLTPSIPSD